VLLKKGCLEALNRQAKAQGAETQYMQEGRSPGRGGRVHGVDGCVHVCVRRDLCVSQLSISDLSSLKRSAIQVQYCTTVGKANGRDEEMDDTGGARSAQGRRSQTARRPAEGQHKSQAGERAALPRGEAGVRQRQRHHAEEQQQQRCRYLVCCVRPS